MSALESQVRGSHAGVDSLLNFAMLASGADAYTLSEFRANLKRPNHGSAAVAVYRLGQSAAVAFTFRDAPIDPSRLAVLDRLAPAIRRLYELPTETARLAAKITAMDTELVGLKVAERARGLASATSIDAAAVTTVIEQVNQVVDSRPADSFFSRLTDYLEDRLEERKLLVAAKELLERAYGLTEEDAYLFLRDKSRTSRRRMKAVAKELLEHPTGWCAAQE
jgi:ANTAR domain